MDDREYWTRKLREAEAELDEARTRAAVNDAASKLQRARASLKALEAEAAERPKRRSSRGRASGAPPHNLLALVDLETGLLEMLDHAGS
jgi:hypothetical protein